MKHKHTPSAKFLLTKKKYVKILNIHCIFYLWYIKPARLNHAKDGEQEQIVPELKALAALHQQELEEQEQELHTEVESEIVHVEVQQYLKS